MNALRLDGLPQLETVYYKRKALDLLKKNFVFGEGLEEQETVIVDFEDLVGAENCLTVTLA